MTVAIESTTTQDVALSVRGLTVSLPKGMERAYAVENISFDLKRGQILCIIGESGSGKSVTANAIMGLLPKVIRVSGGRDPPGRHEHHGHAGRTSCAVCAVGSCR